MISFTDNEVETIKEIINDYGSDCPSTDWEKVLELKYKLGLEKRPTPEELAEQERRRKEWAESDLGKITTEIFKRSNEALIEAMLNWDKDNLFMQGEQWQQPHKIGSELRIKLPTDYVVKNVK